MKKEKDTKKETHSLNKGGIYPKNRDLTMLKKESELLYQFAVRPWEIYTESDLKKLYGTKSKSYVGLFLKKYVKEGMLKTEQIGKTTAYTLNIDSTKARTYAGTVLEFTAWSKKHIPYKDLQTLIDKILYQNYITLITGSYAKCTQNEKSDIDVVVIIENSCEPKKVQAQLNLQAELNIPPIHLYVFKASEFIEMLKNKEVNYGKEIVKNCLILTQGQTYLKMVDEAIKNGFNGKTLYS
jgi:predicted nucleotidyltransferase